MGQLMTRTRFFLLAAFVAWFAHDGHAQVHMSAGKVAFTDARGIAWTPNTCTGWNAFANPGTFPSLIYNATAFTAVAGVPITCVFSVQPGHSYRVLIHLIEAVKTFNAPQRRVFDLYVNGEAAITGIDPFARAGCVECPVDITTVVEPAGDGSIILMFFQSKSSAMFAGIEIIPIAATPWK